MKKILFPTDFSKAADHAFIYALNLAKALGATLTTLHVYKKSDLRGINLPNTLQEIYDDIQLEEFENYQSKIPHLHELAAANNLDQIEIRHVMLEGEVVPTILHLAEKENMDLIVMGTKGATGLREIFLGSIAAKVLEGAETCPVLAVPEKAVFDGQINKIAVTTNYEDQEKEAIKYLLHLAKFFNAQVYCIHVDIAHTEEYTHRMKRFKKVFADEPRLHFTVLEGNFLVFDGNDVEQIVAEWLTNNQIDIVGMLTHKRSFWQSIFENSVTKQMVYHIHTPVLSIKNTVLQVG